MYSRDENIKYDFKFKNIKNIKNNESKIYLWF